MSNLIMVSCNVYELFDVLRSSVAQSLLSIPNNIYNEVSEALKKGLATEVVKRYMLALNIDTALKELQNFIDVNRFAEFLTWLEQNYGIYGLRGFPRGDYLRIAVASCRYIFLASGFPRFARVFTASLRGLSGLNITLEPLIRFKPLARILGATTGGCRTLINAASQGF